VAIAAKYIVALGAALVGVAALSGALTAQTRGAVSNNAAAYQAAAVAALLNWIAGSMALATVIATRHTSQRLNGALGAMLARMALPMAAVLFFRSSKHPLVAAGVVGQIVVLYLCGLIVETVRTVRLVSRAERERPQGGQLPAALTPKLKP
jgi:hypothetical protein